MSYLEPENPLTKSQVRRRLWVAVIATAVVLWSPFWIADATGKSCLYARHEAANNTTKSVGPVATPNRHDQRAAAQHYWNVTVDKLAVAEGYLSVAQAAAQSGDTITASSALQRAENAAKDAGMQSVDGEPDGWTSDVAANLSAASGDFAKALRSMRDFLDNGRPSKASDAKDLNAEASQEISTATAAARQHYMEMGGNAADIQSLDSKVETIMKVVRPR